MRRIHRLQIPYDCRRPSPPARYSRGSEDGNQAVGILRDAYGTAQEEITKRKGVHAIDLEGCKREFDKAPATTLERNAAYAVGASFGIHDGNNRGLLLAAFALGLDLSHNDERVRVAHSVGIEDTQIWSTHEMKRTIAVIFPMFVVCWFGLTGYPFGHRLMLLTGAAAILALGLFGLLRVCTWLSAETKVRANDSAKSF
jgi:hypothetical protein